LIQYKGGCASCCWSCFYKYFGDSAAGAGKFFGECVDAVRVAKDLLTRNGPNAEVETYVSRIDRGVATDYLAHRMKNIYLN
jgi:hypothetical protein